MPEGKLLEIDLTPHISDLVSLVFKMVARRNESVVSFAGTTPGQSVAGAEGKHWGDHQRNQPVAAAVGTCTLGVGWVAMSSVIK